MYCPSFHTSYKRLCSNACIIVDSTIVLTLNIPFLMLKGGEEEEKEEEKTGTLCA